VNIPWLAMFVTLAIASILDHTPTRDTERSLAIAESIVSGEPWTPEQPAQRYVEVFRRDPREGYASLWLLSLSSAL